jgi:gamma-glutamylcyclotransferase (GGCT)/AIG2-like uncharacterized protein YtfP
MFVYGTLRSDSGHAMAQLLSQSAQLLGEAFALGRLYDLGGYPGMVVTESVTDRVKGELYQIRLFRLRATLRTLDDYEACSPAHPEPHNYHRRVIRVSTSRTVVWAWAYLLKRSTTGLIPTTAGNYFDWKPR